jgi:hypothetical protein
MPIKKIFKISNNALTGKEILFLYEKHSDKIEGVSVKKDSLNKKILQYLCSYAKARALLKQLLT